MTDGRTRRERTGGMTALDPIRQRDPPLRRRPAGDPAEPVLRGRPVPHGPRRHADDPDRVAGAAEPSRQRDRGDHGDSPNPDQRGRAVRCAPTGAAARSSGARRSGCKCGSVSVARQIFLRLRIGVDGRRFIAGPTPVQGDRRRATAGGNSGGGVAKRRSTWPGPIPRLSRRGTWLTISPRYWPARRLTPGSSCCTPRCSPT